MSTIEIFFCGMLVMTMLFWSVRFLFSNVTYRMRYQRRSKPSPLRYWMGALTLFLLLGECNYLFCLVDGVGDNPYWLRLGFLFDVHMVPLCGIVLIVLSQAYRMTIGRAILNMLPASLAMIVYLIWPNELLVNICFVAIIIYSLCVVGLVFRSLVRYNRQARDYYSSMYGRKLNWLWLTLIGWVLQFICWLPSIDVGSGSMRVAYFLVSLFVWNFTFIMIYRMILVSEDSGLSFLPETVVEEELEDSADNELAPKAAEKTILNQEQKDFVERLNHLCEEELVFTQEDLTRDDLARMMLMGHGNFTRLLRETKGQSFYEFINEQRVRYAAKLLRESDLDVAQVGFMAGYKYRSTFYRAFSLIYNCTPTAYRNEEVS